MKFLNMEPNNWLQYDTFLTVTNFQFANVSFSIYESFKGS